MAPLQVRSINGDTWPGVPRAEVSQLWTMFLELERTQWLPPIELLAGQLAQVRLLLQHCLDNVPYYRELLQQAKLEPTAVHSLDDFRRLPTVARRTYQEQFPRFQARALPPQVKQTTRMKTSGTSGVPIEVLQTNLVNLWWFAFHLRDLHWNDVDLSQSLAVIRGFGQSGVAHERLLNGVRQEFWGQQLHLVTETGPSFLMDVHQEPRRQLDFLVQVQPAYLLSYPANLTVLAGLLRDSGRTLPTLRAILAIGETLTEDMRAAIETGFGVPVKNTYSCVEAGYLASPCPAGHGLHVHGENVLLEVLDDADRPCAPGQTGRVVLTTLHNFLTPFIRYELGDAVTLGVAACPCGRGLPLLTEVQGKRRPQFVLPDGRRKDSGFLVRELRRVGAYHQHQIVQKSPTHLVVHLVPAVGWTDEHARQVEQSARAYFEADIRVEVLLATQLAPGKAGKLRDVLVEI